MSLISCYDITVDALCSTNGPCDENAACVSVGGPTMCQCNDGFEGDGLTCTGMIIY